MRDFLASLIRMINLKNSYFTDQFNCQDERRFITKNLLRTSQGANGGVLENFDLANISTELAKDRDL